MQRYLIMLGALFVAIIVMSLIKSWQQRCAIARGEDPHSVRGITWAHLVGAVAGLAVFFLGVILLERTASGPDTAYRPATLEDGVISSGGFVEEGDTKDHQAGDAQAGDRGGSPGGDGNGG